MQLVPSIDLREGRCVRLRQGDFAAETVYERTPLELLADYRRLGARWIHVVDLDAVRCGTPRQDDLVATLCGRGVHIQFGGGLRTSTALERGLATGATRLVIGSAALEHPEEVSTWLALHGPERICLAFDVQQDERGIPRIRTHGWLQGGRACLWDVLTWYRSKGLRHILCTDVTRDGTLQGPNLELYAEAMERFPELAWQASGGIRSVHDLSRLASLGLHVAICGRALLEGSITPEELVPFLPDASSPA